MRFPHNTSQIRRSVYGESALATALHLAADRITQPYRDLAGRTAGFG